MPKIKKEQISDKEEEDEKNPEEQIENPKEKPDMEEQISDEQNEDVLEAIMVKLQDLDNRVAGIEAKGLPIEQAEALSPSGQLNSDIKERETGEKEENPEKAVNTASEGDPKGDGKSPQQIPQTNQPPVGDAPGEDLQNKMKTAPQTNAMDDEDEDKKKEQIDDDDDNKNDKKEENLEGEVTSGTAKDPTKPKKSQDSPIPMEGSKANTEKKKEKSEIDKLYNSIKEKLKENMDESLFSRQTRTGVTVSESTDSGTSTGIAIEEYLKSHKIKV